MKDGIIPPRTPYSPLPTRISFRAEENICDNGGIPLATSFHGASNDEPAIPLE